MGILEDKQCGCDNGFIFNFITRKNEQCPTCRQRRKDQIKTETLEDVEGTLEEMLGFGKRVLNKEYEFASVVTDAERIFLTSESMDKVEAEIDELYGTIVNNETVGESKCFGLGIKGNVERLVFPLLVKAWENGYTVHRLVTALEYNRMVNKEDVEVEEMLQKDILFIWINDGCSSREIDSVKGLMQTRSVKGKATFLVTTWLIQACSGLLFSLDEPVTGLAKPVFVEYKTSENNGTDSSYIQRLKGVKNTSADGRFNMGTEEVRKAPTLNFNDLNG